jgi:hypothetical protein
VKDENETLWWSLGTVVGGEEEQGVEVPSSQGGTTWSW